LRWNASWFGSDSMQGRQAAQSGLGLAQDPAIYAYDAIAREVLTNLSGDRPAQACSGGIGWILLPPTQALADLVRQMNGIAVIDMSTEVGAADRGGLRGRVE
jgi:hypothetical protein